MLYSVKKRDERIRKSGSTPEVQKYRKMAFDAYEYFVKR